MLSFVIVIALVGPMGTLAATINLQWDPNIPAPDGYRVFKREQGRPYDYGRPEWSGSTAAGVIDGLETGKTYYFVVRAYIGDQESGDSNEVSHTVDELLSLPAANRPPIADAGTDMAVTVNQQVTLDGSASYDPDNDPISFQWTQLSGPSVTLSNTASATPYFVAHNVHGHAYNLEFQLAVSDQNDLTTYDTCIVHIYPEATTDSAGNDAVDMDDDNDGMPDLWEEQFGFDPTQNDADLDADNDGLTNLDEYLAGSDPTVANTNDLPNKPEVALNESQGNVTNLRPIFTSSEFEDADTDDYHTGTQWQIMTETTDIVLDVTTDKKLTKLKVPRMVLDGNQSYVCQIRHYDRFGACSPWSDPLTFTTIAMGEDSEHDGIDDQKFIAEADLNNDGIADVDQSDMIRTLAVGTGQHLMAISIEDCPDTLSIVFAETVDPKTLESMPPDGYQYPNGLLSYKLHVADPGLTATVKFIMPDIPTEYEISWVKFDTINGWVDYSEHVSVSADGSTALVQVTDGGFGDADGVANGIIIDPSGPALSTTNTQTAKISSGGGGGGCFIGTLGLGMRSSANPNQAQFSYFSSSKP